MGIEAVKNGAVAAFTAVRETSDEAIKLVNSTGRNKSPEFFEQIGGLAKKVSSQLAVGNSSLGAIPGHADVHDEIRGVQALLGKVDEAAQAGALRDDTLSVFVDAGAHARWGAEDAVLHYTRGEIPAWAGNFGADVGTAREITEHAPPISNWVRNQIASGSGWG